MLTVLLIVILLVCVIGLLALSFLQFVFIQKMRFRRRQLLDALQRVREQMPLAVFRAHGNMDDACVEVELFEFDLREYKSREGDVLLIARPDLNLM
ncbi:MAG: hypothetical protein PHD65_05425 [Gallionella sp.]|nr:hypothetical protein [Gallionella sp.]